MVDLQPSPVKKEAEWRVEVVEANWRGVEAPSVDAQVDKERLPHNCRIAHSDCATFLADNKWTNVRITHCGLPRTNNMDECIVFIFDVTSLFICIFHTFIFVWKRCFYPIVDETGLFQSSIFILYLEFFKFCIFSQFKKLERDTIPSYSPIIVTETLERDHYTIKHQQIKRLC